MRSALISIPFVLSLTACGGSVAQTASDAGADTGTGTPSGCAAGQITCTSGCVDPSSDDQNCGSCGTACVAGARCVNATCVAWPGVDGGSPGNPAPGVPPNPGGPTPNGTGSTVLALSKIYYGDSDRTGVQSATAWQQYGLNIDGKITTKVSTDVCTLAAGASRITQVDGTGGIDNSFGENILPILITVAGIDFPSKANTQLQQGDATELVRLDALGSGPDYAPLPGLVYRAAPTTTPPAWNGSDLRDVDLAFTGGSVSSPKVVFGGGYMSQRTWVGEPPTSMPFDMHFVTSGYSAPPLTMHAAQATMLVAQSNASATQGVLAGVLDTQELIDWLKQIAGLISTSLCSGSAFDSIAQQIQQASDVVLDASGAVSNPQGTSCNAISIGLGFDATAVTLGSAVPVPTSMPVCSP